MKCSCKDIYIGFIDTYTLGWVYFCGQKREMQLCATTMKFYCKFECSHNFMEFILKNNLFISCTLRESYGEWEIFYSRSHALILTYFSEVRSQSTWFRSNTLMANQDFLFLSPVYAQPQRSIWRYMGYSLLEISETISNRKRYRVLKLFRKCEFVT